MDPGASKWHVWAKDEAQLHGKKGDPVRSPPRSVSSSTSTVATSTPPPFAPFPLLTSPKAQHREPSDKNMCAKPTQDELNELMPDPVNCFCNEKAHRLDLEEVGPVLVCHRWASQQDPVMCGFHMHQDGWFQFRQELEAGLPLSLDYSGLKTCKHFNFSFCTYFFVQNTFPKLLDNGPNCFCNKPVIEHHYRTSTGCFDLQLRCEMMYTNQKRCNFQVAARNVHFLKSTCHPVVTEKRKEDRSRSKAHAHDLLSALLAKADGYQQKADCSYWEEDKLDTCSSGDSSLSPKSSTPTTISPTLSHPSLLQNINCQNTSVFRKKTSSGINSNQAETTFSSKPLHLYEILQQEQQLERAQQSTPLDWESEQQQIKVEIDRLEQEIDIQNRDMEYTSSMLKDDKLQLEYEKYVSENNHYRYLVEQCDQKRVTNQCKLTQLELQLAASKERDDEDQREWARPKGEDFKCKLCFNRYIEYALIPCYHLGKVDTFCTMIQTNLFIFKLIVRHVQID
jgi:hypothetical protein